MSVVAGRRSWAPGSSSPTSPTASSPAPATPGDKPRPEEEVSVTSVYHHTAQIIEDIAVARQDQADPGYRAVLLQVPNFSSGQRGQETLDYFDHN